MRVEHIMGMPIEIDMRDDLESAVIDGAFALLRRADEVFSTFKPESQISRLARGELRIGDCDPEVDDVLAEAARLRERTSGYFSVRPRGALDPSGLVKGWAVQRAAVALADGGAENFYVNAGGDVVVRGGPEPGEPWRVGIRHPMLHDEVAIVVASRELAIATSGEYERGAHIADPHTGERPRGLLSVTVVGPDLGEADAYATAIFAMGSDGPKWALGLDGYETLCITEEETVLSTPGFDRHRAA
jgi:FAD:protein FMN transferase